MPPAAFASLMASCMPFCQVLPNRASALESGPAVPILISARAGAAAVMPASAAIVRAMRILLSLVVATSLWHSVADEADLHRDQSQFGAARQAPRRLSASAAYFPWAVVRAQPPGLPRLWKNCGQCQRHMQGGYAR